MPCEFTSPGSALTYLSLDTHHIIQLGLCTGPESHGNAVSVKRLLSITRRLAAANGSCVSATNFLASPDLLPVARTLHTARQTERHYTHTISSGFRKLPHKAIIC